MSILWRSNLQCTIRSFHRVGKIGIVDKVPTRIHFRKSSSLNAKEMIKTMTVPAIAVLAWTDVGLWSIFTYLYYHDTVPQLVEYLSDTSDNLQSSEEPKGGFMARYFNLEANKKLAEGIVFGLIARKVLFPLPFKFMFSMFMGGVFNYSKLLYMIVVGPLWASFFLILLSFIKA